MNVNVDDDEPETICCVVTHVWQKLDAGYVALESSASTGGKCLHRLGAVL
jgi:hypothetical protein